MGNSRYKSIEKLIKPESKDNSPDSKNDKLMINDLYQKLDNNEIPKNQSGEEEDYWDTHRMLDEGKMTKDDARTMFKKLKKMNNPV